jgi:P4 family phage/plasmid primase-like protien
MCVATPFPATAERKPPDPPRMEPFPTPRGVKVERIFFPTPVVKMSGVFCKNVEPPGKSSLKKVGYSSIEMDVHALYERLGFVVMSGDMTSYQTKDGTWKKKFGFRKEWEKTTIHDYNKNKNGFAIITGKTSGITAIDIDDPDLPHNEKLMELMSECNMIARTKKGFHYIYKYDERIKGVSGADGIDMDTRNDNNCLFCEPSHCINTEGDVVATYQWTITPMDDEELMELPEEVYEYLSKLDTRYINPEFIEKEEEVQEPTNSITPCDTASVISSLPEVDELLLKLSNEITNNGSYDDWLRNGLICYNERLGLEVWEDMTIRTYPRYKKGSKRDCREKWATFGKEKGRKLTQATWWKWLKQHRPDRYAELMEDRKDFWNLIELINHKDIAKYFWNIHPDAYVWNETLGWFSLLPSNAWKSYENKSAPSGLKRHLADTLQDLAMETKKAELRRYTKLQGSTMDEDKKNALVKSHKENINKIHKAYQMFGSSEFCNGVISFLPSFYDHQDLEEYMDMNRNVFAFNDGVYDLQTDVFRPIAPSDWVCTTTGYNYPKSSNKEVRKELQKFVYELFENHDVANYLWKVLASCMMGYNRFEEYYTFTGSGGNGKGVIAELLMTAFGNYYISTDVSLFTKPVERRDQPIPALVDARPKRLMMTSEPEADDRLQVGLIKKITGGDPVEARTLHSKHIVKYKPQFSVIFQTNSIPQLSKIDGGITRRMRVIRFPFQFNSGTAPNSREGNPDIKDKKCKSAEWRDEFVMMLCELHKGVKVLKQLDAPLWVMEATNNYIDDNNPLKLWLDTHYTITNDENDFIGSTDLKRQFMQDTNREKFPDKTFKDLLGFNNIQWKRKKTENGFVGLRRKVEEMEE